jgi:hypothetical protein
MELSSRRVRGCPDVAIANINAITTDRTVGIDGSIIVGTITLGVRVCFSALSRRTELS